MASMHLLLALLILGMASSISGKLLCEDLPSKLCAYSVSSNGQRCLLEKQILDDSRVKYECQTSNINAQEFAEWVEMDDCIESCGLSRMSIGISSDSLVEKGFAKSLCSSECQEGCPNIVDLFTNLAAGEGASLKQVCNALSNMGSRREMAEVSFASVSSNIMDASASAPSSAPAPSPYSY